MQLSDFAKLKLEKKKFLMYVTSYDRTYEILFTVFLCENDVIIQAHQFRNEQETLLSTRLIHCVTRSVGEYYEKIKEEFAELLLPYTDTTDVPFNFYAKSANISLYICECETLSDLIFQMMTQFKREFILTLKN